MKKVNVLFLMVFLVFFSLYMAAKEDGLRKTQIYSAEMLSNFEFEKFLNIFSDNPAQDSICKSPDSKIVVSNITRNSADFSWNDTGADRYEYFVQFAAAAADPGPLTGTRTDSLWVTARNLSSNNAFLTPDTEYEFFVKSICSDGKSKWAGPAYFRTLCDVQGIPFKESFDLMSQTTRCWLYVDNNKDGGSSNMWKPSSVKYEGTQSMAFAGQNKAMHDDWLISPSFDFDDTKKYRVTYMYRTSQNSQNNFEVLLSNSGVQVADFKKVLIQRDKVSSDSWLRETFILGGLKGEVNLAWRLTSGSHLYVDSFEIEEFKGCAEPMALNVKDVGQTDVTLLWTDELGTDWEYVVQETGMSISRNTVGVKSTVSQVDITTDNSGKTLSVSTNYDFYVRTHCADGTISAWAGPYKFRTLCGDVVTPFWEGFNNDSASWSCWTTLDENRDGDPGWGDDMWLPTSDNTYEGSRSVNFRKHNSGADNDWLISPPIVFEANKTYRLKYHYRVDSEAKGSDFQVLLSDSGATANSFTNVVVPLKAYSNTNWLIEHVIIKGYSGVVHLGWYVSGSSNKHIFIDNVFVEEVTVCQEPLNLGVEDVLSQGVTLQWEDTTGNSKWEYVVQHQDKGTPTANGVETTTVKTAVTKDSSGADLTPNTDYEYYVRSVCPVSGFSAWSGPFLFNTSCQVFQLPYYEGFNYGTNGIRCWTFLDTKTKQVDLGANWKQIKIPYEGDASVMYSVFKSGKDPMDAWAISPSIELNGGDYILKYHFRTTADISGSQNNEFEVLLSQNGTNPADFTTTLVPSTIYSHGDYVEHVISLNGYTGTVNLAWHVVSKSSNSYLYLDNVVIKEVLSCPEPINVKVSNETTTSFDLEWEQTGNVTSWEVLVVDYLASTSGVPIVTTTVTNDPKTTITGMQAGRGYTVYVRALCQDGVSYSDWSTSANLVTQIGANDTCFGAANLPVNPTLDCAMKLVVSNIGATNSDTKPNTANCPYFGYANDLWYEFTAISDTHILQATNLVLNSGSGVDVDIAAILYDTDCNDNTGPNAIASHCGRLFKTQQYELVLQDLTIGQKYFLKLGFKTNDELLFELCLTTPTPLEVSASGTTYSVEELIKDVFVSSNCDLVTEIHYQNGDGSAQAKRYNTFGAFERGATSFPFEKGIVLSTNEIDYVAGPWRGGYAPRGNNNQRWIGDKDINDAITSAGGGPRPEKRVTQVEFEFTPLKDSIQFEYLFASNSYLGNNGNYRYCNDVCDVGAMFAAWLIDTTTDEGENLAKVPGTNSPISISTIRNSDMSGAECGNENPEYYWKHYDGVDIPAESPIDFVGYTVPMKSALTAVVPGRKYRIKFAVIDFCTSDEHSSAVFFNASSFDLGTLDLGEDLLIDKGNAICDGEAVEIKTEIAMSDEIRVDIQWYKDGVALSGEKSSNLMVTHTGDYKIVVKYPELNCESVGEIRVEMFPPISLVVARPENIEVCPNSLRAQQIDLSMVEDLMFENTDRDNYLTTYYDNQAKAVSGSDSMDSIYEMLDFGVSKQVFIRVEDLRTGCYEVFTFNLVPGKGDAPEKPEDVVACAWYTLPQLGANQYYYSESMAMGVSYQAGDVLDQDGEYTMYILQRNGQEGCYEEVSFTISITKQVVADEFEDKTLNCEVYVLKPLSEFNAYYTEPNGQGENLLVGSPLIKSGTIYVYAESEDGLCTDESSFTITYEECPIQKGISPNGDGLNDVFDLSSHGVFDLKIYNRYGSEVYTYGYGYTNQWAGQDKSGNALPDGTYYYVIISRDGTRTGWVQIVK